MKKKIVIAAAFFLFALSYACSSAQKKPNCEELKKACAQAQEVCETLEPLTGEEVVGIQHK